MAGLGSRRSRRPEAAGWGNIGKIVDGDDWYLYASKLKINVRLQRSKLLSSDDSGHSWQECAEEPKAYAAMVSSADKGAGRLLDRIELSEEAVYPVVNAKEMCIQYFLIEIEPSYTNY